MPMGGISFNRIVSLIISMVYRFSGKKIVIDFFIKMRIIQISIKNL